MAEDDEIDILGDFNLDNYKSDTCLSLVSENSDLLNCDYTIHPQWLLDKPSANPDNWYKSTGELTDPGENESSGHVSTENCITDESGWTEKEKNLLERGIEIFGKSNVRLSQFIGSKSASEVKYYLKNFYNENQTASRTFSGCLIEDNVINDTEIPASIEEVIAAVSTGKSSISISSKRARKKSNSFSGDSSSSEISNIPSGQSLLKSYYLKAQKNNPKEFKKKLKLKSKFKVSVHINRHKEHKIKEKYKVKATDDEKKIVETRKVEITTGVGLAVPISDGEEIIKLKNVENESDEDVDVDIEDDDEEQKVQNIKEIEMKDNIPDKVEVKEEENIKTEPEEINESNNALHTKQFIDLSAYSDETVRQLLFLDEPSEEVCLVENEITELEKAIHNEFFEGRTTKTPERYLKIRNYIINTWKSNKPTYVTKTSVRQGLKSCGDVNCIGRVHYFLEQIGAINFGCEQMKYVRPLYDMLQTHAPQKNKSVKELVKQGVRSSELGSRPRIKKKFANDGEGGCTLTHDENGEIINTTIVNEEPAVKQRLYVKKPSVRLIFCRPFTDEKPQDYTLNIHLSALLKMDFHAHTNLTEVMGLVAGHWNSTERILEITHYETCKNIASSATHCDMCPISQAKAAELIDSKGLDILGWFHSHPTFAPEPSQQDLETQQSVQQWIGNKRPCIGVILSPFSLNGALIASPYRCMIVDKKVNFEDQFVPYKFQVNVLSNEFVVEDFLMEMTRVLEVEKDGPLGSKISLDKPYFQDTSITFLDKFIYSVRMHLAKCGNFSKMTCDSIIQGIIEITSKYK